MAIKDIISGVLLLVGLFFALTTVIGIFRLPDFYSRCHTSGNSETLALLLICAGFIVQTGFQVLSIKIVILFIIICFCNPIGTHILAKTAHRSGYPMWKKEKGEKKDADVAR
jgi:multicomponent Na+:H+ antiporter subunit G